MRITRCVGRRHSGRGLARSAAVWPALALAMTAFAVPAFAVPALAAPGRVAAAPPAATASPAPVTSDRLTLVASTAGPLWNGVASAGGRLFVEFPRLDPGKPNPSVAVIGPDGAPVPFPGQGWNDWRPGADPTRAFVSTNAIHVGPHGDLWVVDNGAVGFIGKQAVPNAAKIVVLDPASGRVLRVYPVPRAVLKPKSAIDDIRFNGARAYVTDAGAPGLLVLDLEAGTFRRVLDNDKSTTARRPAIVDGHILRGPDGKPAAIHADQLEVTPDGDYLYYQPLPGPLYRIATKLLDDPAVKPDALSAAVEFWYNTPSLGGTAIDRAGNLYLDDLGSDAVLKLTPDRHLSLLVRDDRLHWPDAPAFDGSGGLLLPVAQIDRAAPFNGGHSRIVAPFQIFRLKVGATRPADE